MRSELLELLHGAGSPDDTIGAEVEMLVLDPVTGGPRGPAGQIEVRTPPVGSVSALAPALRDVVDGAVADLARAGLAGVPLGFHPFAPLRSAFGDGPEVATAEEMVLTFSAAVHVSVSYRDEEDARRKLVAARELAPYFVALFGGSPIASGRALAASVRASSWLSAFTEYRVPASVLEASPGMFERYVDWLLARPADGDADPRERLRIPTADVRLKEIVEVRIFDSMPVAAATAAAAMVRGLLADPANLAAVSASPSPAPERRTAWSRCAVVGLAAVDGRAAELVEMAKAGLVRLGDDPGTLGWAFDVLRCGHNWGQQVAALWGRCRGSRRQFVGSCRLGESW